MKGPYTLEVRPVLSWGIATSLVAATALALLLWAAWRPAPLASAQPPASVMVVFAAQAMSPETQQAAAVGARRSAASSAAQPKKSTTRQEALPVLARAAAPGIAVAEKEAKAEASPSPDPGKDGAREASMDGLRTRLRNGMAPLVSVSGKPPACACLYPSAKWAGPWTFHRFGLSWLGGGETITVWTALGRPESPFPSTACAASPS